MYNEGPVEGLSVSVVFDETMAALAGQDLKGDRPSRETTWCLWTRSVLTGWPCDMACGLFSRIALFADSNFGICPVCEKWTLFVKSGPWLRDEYYCVFCRSIPRQRALIYVLQLEFPDWRDLSIYESSPSGASSEKLRKECKDYSATQYWPDLPSGEYRNGTRCENLEALSFSDAAFDLVITQDVFEHVMHPERAFAEVARVLRPGGCHIFTVPLYHDGRSVVRARDTGRGIQYLKDPGYHANPVDEKGSLVVTDWGDDLLEFIHVNSGMKTDIRLLREPSLGIEAEFLEIFISRKVS